MSSPSFPKECVNPPAGISTSFPTENIDRTASTLGPCDETQRFLLPAKKQYNAQYFNLYNCRIGQIRKHMIPMIHSILVSEGKGDLPVFSRIIDQHPGQQGIIFGHIYKDMPNKPCILDEYEKDCASHHTNDMSTNYCSVNDSLALEDEHGRVNLILPSDVRLYSGDGTTEALYGQDLCLDMLVTGLVVGVQCTVNEVGDLIASRVFMPSSSIRVADKLPSSATLEDSTYTAFVSDLSVGNTDLAAHQQCIAFLQGALGGAADAQLVSRIGQVVVLGNTVASTAPITDEALSADLKAAYEPAFAAGSLHLVGHALAEVASACPVTVLPGSQDPSNHMIPQQPFHQCLFPLASTYSSFNSITNPGMVQMEDKSILMTDGHNVSDMVRLSSLSPLSALTLSLQSRLIAPTAPDTYGCYPYKDYDPLVIDNVPDIYAVGGQPRPEWREVIVGNSQLDSLPDNHSDKRCLLLCVPSFFKTKQIVLVNSSTNEVMTVSFEGVDDMIANEAQEQNSKMQDS